MDGTGRPDERPGGRPPGRFADLLTAFRGKAQLTQEGLAIRSGLSVGAISLLERGARTSPRSHTVARLADALGLGPIERRAFAAAARRRPTVGEAREPHRPGKPKGITTPPELRLPATRFVGRETELADVRALLRRADIRLLTLTGAPGAGKTRLALEAATAEANHYLDGVIAVALGALTDARQVMPAIRTALGLTEARNSPAVDTVAAYCAERHLLLLLDNFEHLLPALPELADLLERCPNSRALLTSRVATRAGIEREFPVPALGLPGAAGTRAGDPAILAAVPAVALFLERAASARPGFRLGPENAEAVAEICRRLDGLPLALELAAPWIRLLTPPQMLGQLTGEADLLVGGTRERPERQRTMRATLAWSCELLGADDRALLRRLSIFRGGAPLSALDDVCLAASPLTGGVLPHLAVLVDHSLVGRHEAVDGAARVSLLETVREYGRELLADAGEEEPTALAHLEHYADLAVRFDREVRGGGQAAWLERFRAELDNIRIALAWAIEHGEVEPGLRLAGFLWHFWEFGGRRREGHYWLDQLLANGQPADAGIRAQALKALGFLQWRLGSPEQAIETLRTSRTLFEELGDRHNIAETTRGLGDAYSVLGDLDSAISLIEQAVADLRELGSRAALAQALANLGLYYSRTGARRRATALYEEALAINRELDNVLAMALCLTNLGHQAHITGDFELATTRLEEAITVSRRLASPFYIAAALANLGDVFRERGEVDAARAHYSEALLLFADLGDPSGVASSLRCVAWADWSDGQPARAARFYGAAEKMSPAAVSYDIDDAPLHDEVRASLAKQLGAEAYEAAYEAGCRMSMRDAATEAST